VDGWMGGWMEGEASSRTDEDSLVRGTRLLMLAAPMAAPADTARLVDAQDKEAMPA